MINEGWTRYQSEGRHIFALGKWWTPFYWEVPATKTPHKAAPKHLAQAAKGRPKQTATDQQQKTIIGPFYPTKATVPERYQDETQAEVQELVRLNRVIMEERRKTAHLNNIFQAEQREHEHLIELRQNHYKIKEERRETFRQLYPQHAHLLPPPAAHMPCPPSLELQQQGEKASSLTVQP